MYNDNIERKIVDFTLDSIFNVKLNYDLLYKYVCYENVRNKKLNRSKVVLSI